MLNTADKYIFYSSVILSKLFYRLNYSKSDVTNIYCLLYKSKTGRMLYNLIFFNSANLSSFKVPFLYYLAKYYYSLFFLMQTKSCNMKLKIHHIHHMNILTHVLYNYHQIVRS